MTTPTANVDLRASQQDVTLKATIPFAVFAVIAVICRFISRRIQKLRFEFDDYMSLAALIFTLGCFTLSMEMTRLGSGKHIAAVPLENIPRYFKCLFAYEFLYGTAILTIKLCVLSLYRRIFSVAKFKLAANVVQGVVIAWWIAVILVSIFSCNPINGFWDKMYTKSTCINTEHFFIGNAVPNIATDIVILILPLREIWHLNTQRHQKIALSFIFLLGGFVVVASLVRLAEQFKVNDPDFTWALNGTVIWSSIEPSCGVISACLPTLRPLVLNLFPRLFSSSASSSSNNSPYAAAAAANNRNNNRNNNSKNSGRKSYYADTVRGGGGGGGGYADLGTPPRRKNQAGLRSYHNDRNDFVFADGPTTTISSSSTFGHDGRGFDFERDDVLLDAISVQKDVSMTSEIV